MDLLRLDSLPQATRENLETWELRLCELEAQAPKRHEGVLHLGAGEFVTNDNLPPSSVARMVMFSVMVDLAPQVFDDAVERSERLIEAHGDFMAYAAARCAEHFRRSVEMQPSSNPRLQAERTRRLLRRRHRWISAFYDRHGRDVLLAFANEYGPWMEKWRIGNAQHPECSLLMMGLSQDLVIWRKARQTPPRWYILNRMLELAAPLSDVGLAVPLPTVPKAAGKLPSWNPGAETKETYLARSRAIIDRQLHNHIHSIENESLQKGLERVPTKRNGDEHFRWLVRYQVLGESQTAIARLACVERQTVQSAIRSTAGLMPLPLRDALPAGRRRHTTVEPATSKSRNAA
ncbi:MAG: hypothetical protein M3464_10990 [Chloroflexota bacterium]|nr:hypothetical protein [Chloroflexota bacterium]